MKMYLMAARTLYPKASSIKIIFKYLPTGPDFHLDWTPELDASIRRKIAKTAKAMRSGDITASPGKICIKCAHSEYCKPFANFIRKTDTEQIPVSQEFEFFAVPDARPNPSTPKPDQSEKISTSPPSSRCLRTLTDHSFHSAMRCAVGTWNPERTPNKNESFHIISDGSFNIWGFFSWIAARGEIIEELNLSIWSIEQDALNEIMELFDAGLIQKLNVAFARRTASRYARFFEDFQTKMIDRGQSLRVWSNHAKVLSVKIGDLHLTLSGSGNIQDFRRYDSYVLTNSEELFEHHRDWITYEDKEQTHSLEIPIPQSEGYVSHARELKVDQDISGRALSFFRWAPLVGLEKDETLHIMHDGRFDFLGTVLWCLEKLDFPDVSISSWGWSRAAVIKLMALFDAKKIRSLHFVICHTLENKDINLTGWLKSELTKRGQTFRIWVNHSKIAAMKTNDDGYVVSTSANMSRNIFMEQVDITRSKSIADSHFGWMKSEEGLEHQRQGKDGAERTGRIRITPPFDPNAEHADVFVGRFQPFHKGHFKVIKAMKNPIVFIIDGEKSKEDKESNPLSLEYRISLLNKCGVSKIYSYDTGFLPILLAKVRRLGFEPKRLFCGKDRIKSYKTSIKKIIYSLSRKRGEHPRDYHLEFVETLKKDRIHAKDVRAAIRNKDRILLKTMMPPQLWPELDALCRKIQ